MEINIFASQLGYLVTRLVLAKFIFIFDNGAIFCLALGLG